MKREELIFPRPAELAATAPAEVRGVARDAGRLMVSTPSGHRHARFHDLPEFLRSGDLLVVNRSATLPASLPASGRAGDFRLNLSTYYGGTIWLAEPRWSAAEPGPLHLSSGDWIEAAGIACRLLHPFPGLPRLWFVQAQGDLHDAMRRAGSPIRYGYVSESFPLAHYQTVFSEVPGSAEMPSAAYPFTPRLVDVLLDKGVEITGLVLHTGVSSLEIEVGEVEKHPLYPEPFEVDEAAAEAINAARREGRRVIAVGTTVVRALESVYAGGRVHAAKGFTRVFVHPRHCGCIVDGLLTGLHDPVTSHLAMLYALAGQDLVRSAYAEAVRAGYLWHEFGDSHLIFKSDPADERADTASRAA